MQLDGMRVERFFHVEDPVIAARLCNKFKVRNEVADFSHAAIEIAHDTLETVHVRCGSNELFGKATCIIELFEERCRVRFVFGEDAIRVRKAAAAILLLGKLLADFHEETVQSLFGFAQSFGKLVAEFMKFRLFCRDAACNFCNETIATRLGRLKRLRNVSESEERDGAAKHLIADFGQAVCFVKHDVFVRWEQSKVKLQIRKEERMIHKHHVRIHGLALCNERRAVFVMRVIFAAAARGAARELGPKHTIAALAKGIAFVDVARFSREDPRNERHEGIAFFGGEERLRVHQQFFELAEAKVIVAALQNCRAEFAIVNLCNLRDGFGPELFLQGARCRTDEHAFARDSLVRCSNEVRQSLSGTGRSFEHAEAALVHVAFHDRGKILLVVARLVIIDDKRDESAFLEELAYARSLGLGQSFQSRCGRQLVLRRRKLFDFRSEKRFVVGTLGHHRKGVVNPRVHRRNLFESLHEQASACIGIGQGAVSAATFNVQFLHERIEAMVRHILICNARKRERIPEHVGIVRNPNLRKRLLQELGIENGIVRHNREVTDERADLACNRRKIRGAFQIGLADSSKRFDKGAKFRRRWLYQKIKIFLRLAIFKANKRDLDYFVFFEIETCRFQVKRYKCGNLYHLNPSFMAMPEGSASVVLNRLHHSESLTYQAERAMQNRI